MGVISSMLSHRDVETLHFSLCLPALISRREWLTSDALCGIRVCPACSVCKELLVHQGARRAALSVRYFAVAVVTMSFTCFMIWNEVSSLLRGFTDELSWMSVMIPLFHFPSLFGRFLKHTAGWRINLLFEMSLPVRWVIVAVINLAPPSEKM